MKSLNKVLLVSLVVVSHGLVGCGKNSQPAPSAKTKPADHSDHKSGEERPKSEGRDHAKHGHHHDGWWCDEHGVPEEICGQCDGKLAADFQKKGDWCKEHDRPDSQCFKCHPELQARFAAKYEAKYGKKPPTPES